MKYICCFLDWSHSVTVSNSADCETRERLRAETKMRGAPGGEELLPPLPAFSAAEKETKTLRVQPPPVRLRVSTTVATQPRRKQPHCFDELCHQLDSVVAALLQKHSQPSPSSSPSSSSRGAAAGEKQEKGSDTRGRTRPLPG